MDELEELRKRRLAQLQERQKEQVQRQYDEQRQAQAQFEELESVVKQFLTKEALQRYGNIRIAHQEKAVSVVVALGQLIQSGRIKEQLTDAQFKDILKKLEPERPGFTIKK